VAAAALVAVSAINARIAAGEKKENKPESSPAKDAKTEKPADKNASPKKP
jgi:hypothetical protein